MVHRLAPSGFVLGIVFLVSLILGLAPVAAVQGDEPKILRIWWSTEMVDDLEPQQTASGSVDVTFLNYEGLTRFDEELAIAPAAAESWEFNADGTVLTFHLRENLTYSDGTPLTAERYRYAIARNCDPHLGSWDAGDLFDIVGCEELNLSLQGETGSPEAVKTAYEEAKANLGVRALDDRTLEIRLRRPAPYFPALTSGVGFMPVRQELVEAGGPDMWLDPATWVGNGPFQVTGIEPDADPPRITLTRNERYWGGHATLDGIEYMIMSRDEALEAYQRDELQIIRPDFDRLAELEADPILGRDLLKMPAPFVGIFNLNVSKAPFDDKQVREAFAYAFDRASYCREIERDTCTPSLSWIPPEVPGAIETDAYAYDPERARETLAASTYGSPEHLPEIVWYHGSDAWDREQAEWIADQYRQVLGVELTLTSVSYDELDALFDSAEIWPQIAGTYWYSDLPDPHEWMLFWTCVSEYFAADIGYCNPEYDALVERADTELDPEERIRLAEESQRLLIADAPAIFGYHWDTIVLVKPYVTGYSRTAPYQYWPGWWTPLTVDIAPVA